MNIIGINAYHADSSACLLSNGKLIAAVEEERLNRIKHWAGFPFKSISYCLNIGKLKIEDIDFFVFNKSNKNFLKKIEYALFNPSKLIINLRKFNNLKNKNTFFEVNKVDKNKIINLEHHLSHHASSYYYSNFSESALLSIDGFGDFTSTTSGFAFKNEININDRVYFPHSLGIFYQAMTQYLGFHSYGDEYKVMGLSAYGTPKFKNLLYKIIYPYKNFFKLNLNFFNHDKFFFEYAFKNKQPFFPPLYNENLIDILGPKRNPDENLTKIHFDLASSIQCVYEEILYNILDILHDTYKSNNLCLSGGCAMNSLANGKIHKNTKFNNIFIPPSPGDGGAAVGSAIYFFIKNNNKKIDSNFIGYTGKKYTQEEIDEIIEFYSSDLDPKDFKIHNFFNFESRNEYLVKQIIKSKIIGMFQGSMEWGPRALGNRSILADPRNKNMKNILNLKIKKRESFRPFAPSILLDQVNEWFEDDLDVPFMSKVIKFKEKKIDIIPSVVHVDLTGRLQTVNKNDSLSYYDLIEKFFKITSVPILLNTSFNENEPIVESPTNAIDCFLRTKMDYLVLNNKVIERLNGI